MADHPTQGPSPHEQAPVDYDPNEVIADLVGSANVDPSTMGEFVEIYPELDGIDVEAVRGQEPETVIVEAPEDDVHEGDVPAIEMADPDDPDQVVNRQPRTPAKRQVTGRPDEDPAIRAARAHVLAQRRILHMLGRDADEAGYKLD